MFPTLQKLREGLRERGFERSEVVGVAIDFTASNLVKHSANVSFGGKDLHLLSAGSLNPYEAVCDALGKFLLPIADSDMRVPVWGFGDSMSVDTPNKCFLVGEGTGVRGVLELYRTAVGCFYSEDSNVKMSGPTSFEGPIRFAIGEAAKAPDRLSILIIITDGALTDTTARTRRGTLDMEKSPTTAAIREASKFPLEIVIIGVGDGPFGLMESLDDAIGERRFDNVQFISATPFMGSLHDPARMDDFVRRALCELPLAMDDLGRLGFTERGARPTPFPGPLPFALYSPPAPASHVASV